jgi:hypothetical protein
MIALHFLLFSPEAVQPSILQPLTLCNVSTTAESQVVPHLAQSVTPAVPKM